MGGTVDPDKQNEDTAAEGVATLEEKPSTEDDWKQFFSLKCQLYDGGKDPAVDPDFRGGEHGDTSHKTVWEIDPIPIDEFDFYKEFCVMANTILAKGNEVSTALVAALPDVDKAIVDQLVDNLIGGRKLKFVIMDADGRR